MMTIALILSLFSFSLAWADPETESSAPDAPEAPADGAQSESTEASQAAPSPTEEPPAGEAEPDSASETLDSRETPTSDEVPVTEEASATPALEPAIESDTDAEEESEEQETDESPEPLSIEDLESAETATQVDKSFFDFLKPTREKLPQNPYGNTQYTAYALEFGQLRVGVNQTAVGIAPRVQLGTAPALDALGIYNGSVKANALHFQRFDLAVEGAYYTLDAGLNFEWIRGGAITSLQLTEPWSLHLGGSYDRLRVDGIPQLSTVSNLLVQDSADTLSAWQTKAEEEGLSLQGNQSMVSIRMATDYRFNRRDAIVLQGSAIIWSDADWGIDGLDPASIPPVLNLSEVLFDESSFKQSVSGSYVASLAYQRSRKHMDMRFGLGVSAVKYAWLLQTFELSYNFGGKTRRDESRLKRTWRRNKKIDG